MADQVILAMVLGLEFGINRQLKALMTTKSFSSCGTQTRAMGIRLLNANTYQGLDPAGLDQLLMESKLQPNKAMLQKACHYGSLNLIQHMITKYRLLPDTPMLQEACSFNTVDVVKYLVRRHRLRPDQNMLRQACKNNKVSVIDYLITKCKLQPNLKMLDLACTFNTIGAAHYLVNLGFKPTAAMLEWSRSMNDTEMVQYLETLV